MPDKKIQLKNQNGDNLYPHVKMLQDPAEGERSEFYLNGEGRWSKPAGGSGGGHTYNVTQGTQQNKFTLTEDGEDKATITIDNVAHSSAAPWSGVTNKQADRGCVVEDDKIKLNETFYNYLVQQTFEVPTVELTRTPTTASYEYGKTLSVTFKHKETNIGNISGTLSLFKGSAIAAVGITPTTTSTSIAYTLSDVITSTITMYLKCTDALGTQRSASLAFSCYKPCWYGMSQSATITGITGLTKKASASLGTITATSVKDDYCYFVTAGTISKITSGGFDVPYIKQSGTINVDLNGQSVAYNVYRTAGQLVAGSNTFTVS